MAYINVSNTHAKYTGEFSGEISTMIHEDRNRTNVLPRMLDIEKKGMDKKQLIRDFRMLLDKFNGNIEKLAEHTNIPVFQINELLSEMGLTNEEMENSKHCNHCNENIQIGDRVEVNFQGDGHTNNFSGMLNDSQKNEIAKLKEKISYLEKMGKEKDEVIEALKETVEALKNKQI